MAAPASSQSRRGHQRADTLNKFARFEQDFNRNVKRSNSATIPEDLLSFLDLPEEKSSEAPKRESLKRIWECSVCTFHNNTHMRYCEICGVMRDANAREQMSPTTSPQPSPGPPISGDDGDLLSMIQTNNKSREERPISQTLSAPYLHTRTESTPAVIHYVPSRPKPNRSHQTNHRRTGSIPHPLDPLGPETSGSDDSIFVEKRGSVIVRQFDPLEAPDTTSASASALASSPSQPAVPAPAPPAPPAPTPPAPSVVGSNTEISVTGPPPSEREGFWTCHVCTYAENPLEFPVCAMCSALPPEAPPSPEPNSGETWEALGGQAHPQVVRRTERRPSRETDLINFPEATGAVISPSPSPLSSSSSSQRQIMNRPKRSQSEHPPSSMTSPPLATGVRSPREKTGLLGRVLGRFARKGEDDQVPALMKQDSMALPSELNEDARNDKPFSIATISPEKRQKLVKKLEKLETKKDLLNYLDQTIVKVRDKLQKHVTCLLQYKKQLDRTKVEYEEDSRKWAEFCIRPLERKADDYFSNRILFYTTCHDVEKMYADCFSEKLKKLKHAKQKIDRNKRHYSIEDMRMNIETAFDIAWRIRISDTVPEKQELLRDLRQIIDSEKEEYKTLKATYDVEVNPERRQNQVRGFLDRTLRVVSERRMGAMKQRRRERDRDRDRDRDDESMSDLASVVSSLSNGSESGDSGGGGGGGGQVEDSDDFYYHEHDHDKQDDFNCFLLDRRMREGRIIHKWLIRQEEGQDEPSLESTSEFLRRLTATFCDSYSLEEETYYDCVELYLYRCMFVHNRFSKLVSDILQDETEITSQDELFLRKTFWMRTLKQGQLGIEEQFRMEHDVDSLASILSAIETDTSSDSLPPPTGSLKSRKPSSLALVAGSEMPYAIAINIFGDIRKAVNPHQVLRILLQAVKCINDTASTYARDKGSRDFVITGDSLFPIVVYCVVQCGLEEPHKHILLLETMLPRQSTYGAGAFALSVIKAAVSYILQANPVDFGLPAEIEAE